METARDSLTREYKFNMEILAATSRVLAAGKKDTSQLYGAAQVPALRACHSHLESDLRVRYAQTNERRDSTRSLCARQISDLAMGQSNDSVFSHLRGLIPPALIRVHRLNETYSLNWNADVKGKVSANSGSFRDESP